MSQQGNTPRSPRRNNARRAATPVDPWSVPPPLPAIEPIVTPDDVTALLQSLGDPPIPGGTQLASYFAAVVERAASVATALALSAVLPAAPPDTTDPDPPR